MKTKAIFLSLSLAAAVFVSLTNCSGQKKEADHSHDAHAHEAADAKSAANGPQYQVDATFQQQLADVFTSYIKLKDAFVASDANLAKTEAASVNAALDKTDMKLLSGSAHHDWMNFLTPMQTALKEIQAATDIEVQRRSFYNLSDNLYKSIKGFGLGGKEAFYEFCPMAFNDEGAYWLSDQEKIRNPYFGDKMLSCGNVQERLK
jgi:Cu(I)/Ag(I) efflux system membrane fusion protein